MIRAGGNVFQVKPGNVVNIPPGVAHWAGPDKNGLTYLLLKVNVGVYPWTNIAAMSEVLSPEAECVWKV